MVGWVGSPLGLALLLAGGYLILRTLVDLATSRTITGEVLWLQVWRSTAQDKNAPSVPWLYYLAVDDGTSERTTAWGMTREWESLVHDRDVVTIRVRPWSRRVTSLGVVTPGRTRTLVDAPVADPDAGSPA